MGRFMSPDKVDPNLLDPQSLNMYDYAGNNPLRYFDPDGLYREDVHHDLTLALAIAAGYSLMQAQQIANANQGVDDNPMTSPMHIIGGASARRQYHFTTRARRDELWNDVDSEETLGVYLHPEQDSFSHAGFGPRIGHLLHGTRPDRTYLNPTKADNMARDTYGALLGAGLSRGAPGVPYDLIFPFVAAFNRARSASEKDSQLNSLKMFVSQYQGHDVDGHNSTGAAWIGPGAAPTAIPGPGPGPH